MSPTAPHVSRVIQHSSKDPTIVLDCKVSCNRVLVILCVLIVTVLVDHTLAKADFHERPSCLATVIIDVKAIPDLELPEVIASLGTCGKSFDVIDSRQESLVGQSNFSAWPARWNRTDLIQSTISTRRPFIIRMTIREVEVFLDHLRGTTAGRELGKNIYVGPTTDLVAIALPNEGECKGALPSPIVTPELRESLRAMAVSSPFNLSDANSAR